MASLGSLPPAGTLRSKPRCRFQCWWRGQPRTSTSPERTSLRCGDVGYHRETKPNHAPRGRETRGEDDDATCSPRRQLLVDVDVGTDGDQRIEVVLVP